jgi:CTD small phosphatase-like protein 2
MDIKTPNEAVNPRQPQHKPDPKLIQSTMEHDENFYEALRFIKTIPKIDLFERPKITIPNKDPNDNGFKYTLVLDLDETLVHSSIEPQTNPDDVFLIEMNENRYTIYVK